MTALIHDHVSVAALYALKYGRHVARSTQADVPPVKVVGRPREDDRVRTRPLWPVDVGLHPEAVTHRDHHLAVDDRKRLKLGLDLVTFSPCFLVRGGIAGLCEN